MANVQMYYCKLNKDGKLVKAIPFLGSVYKKTVRTPQDKGISIAQSVIVRTAETALQPGTGDMIAFQEPTPEQVAEGSLKLGGAVTIQAVNDNRRGFCPHWKMEGV